ncbi:universal stress protein [Aeromicrobium sp. YIM 150415]|uniref:universal stress protein n=1 Tax=Aeromicrobium sp. YIM 150415 TaxID=2803912 RepID=UPI0019640831|nr:universal stress protein [Aeromicrobium sp. YIM 150415]MBM9463824.1 universal stress protein [Aeromicrobium sp. YIM 150415]
MSTTIVVGVDGSRAGAAALRWAAHEADLRGAELHMVHSWQIDAAEAMGGYAIPWLAMENDARANAQQWVEDVIGPLDQADSPRKLSVVSGMPGPVLVEASRDAALLVVGTQVHKGLSRVFQGSVSHYCLTHSTTIVVAVPAPAEDVGS